jgi:spoIIIJ-associated protein
VTDESELAADVRELVERIVGGFGVHGYVEIDEDDDSVVATVVGGDLGLLIGRHGQTIDAVQYLLNAIAYRGGAAKAVVVDASGYRERRRATVEGVALRAAQRALATGELVELEPMSSVERRIVHMRLADESGVQTRSEGDEPNRYVVVEPA